MTLKWLGSGVILLFLHCPLWSQENVKISKGHFKTGIDIGFKEAWKSIKEGNKSYKDGKGTYDLARDHYLYAEQYNPENAELNYKLGVCYLFTDNKYQAINYLHKAYTLEPDVSGDIHFLLGQAYQLVLEFDKAVEHYNAHRAILDPTDLLKYDDQITKRLTECQHGRVISQEPVRVILQNLGDSVNSKYDDYNPIFAFEDSALFFTSRRPFEKSKRNNFDNKFDEDIYLSVISGDDFNKARRIDKPFNSNKNDALVGIASGGNTMLIYKGHIDGGDIQISSYLPEKAKWSRPKSLAGRLTSKEGETSACFSPNGDELYYVSRNAQMTLGGKDIMLSRLDLKGKWSKPINLGSTINTPYDEEGIFITPDGRNLYFASQGHNSMGGFDIFRSDRETDGSWSDPVNLGYPINTPDDEVFYITDKSDSYGYYSAIRDGGLGAKDIYRVIYLGSEKELIFLTKDQLVAGTGPVKTGFLSKPEFMVLDTTFVLTGQVLDTAFQVIPVLATLSFIDPNTGDREAYVMSDTSGTFTARLPEPKVYGVEINAEGYLYFLDILDLTMELNDEILHRNFYLKKVEVGTKVVLKNIYFETGKAILRPGSFDALDQVLRFLENNPTVKLEISGHTDNTGSLRINQKLSRDRAKAVVDYLVAGGANPEMLVYEGYADSQSIDVNTTIEGRRKNRRVEFKVLSK